MKNRRTLTLEQCRALLALTLLSPKGRGREIDHALVMGLLLVGSEIRTWTWEVFEEKLTSLPSGVYEAFKVLAKQQKVKLFAIKNEWFTKAHWIGGRGVVKKFIFTLTPTLARSARESAWTTQEVSRRLHRFGRMAGIVDCNLRLLVNTHHLLIDLYGDAEAASEQLSVGTVGGNLSPASSLKGQGRLKAEPRLHGMFRRSSFVLPR